jgi:hypothetical protein
MVTTDNITRSPTNILADRPAANSRVIPRSRSRMLKKFSLPSIFTPAEFDDVQMSEKPLIRLLIPGRCGPTVRRRYKGGAVLDPNISNRG